MPEEPEVIVAPVAPAAPSPAPASDALCCAKFDPKPWDGKRFDWHNKLFVKDHFLSLFYIPIDHERVIARAVKAVTDAEAKYDVEMVLWDENSFFGTDLYVEAKAPVEGETMVKIDGTFISKVFEGDPKETPKWVADMVEYVQDKGQHIKKLYYWYTTCPKCAKIHGKNYTVLIAEI